MCSSFSMYLNGRSLVSVDEQSLLTERVDQDHAAATVVSVWGQVSVMLLALQCVYLSGQLHSVSAEVVHGDGVVPVAQVVLLTRRLLLPLHAAHSQQHRA